MLAAIDALDIVSLLLGAALAYVGFLALKPRLGDTPVYVNALIVVGSTAILGYGLSEILHALPALRH